MRERQDRLAELEGTVRELQATVLALTEELVEANERLRHLEAERDDGADGQQVELGQAARETSGRTAGTADAPGGPGEEPTSGAAESSDEGDRAQKAIPDESHHSTDQRDSGEDDIIIA